MKSALGRLLLWFYIAIIVLLTLSGIVVSVPNEGTVGDLLDLASLIIYSLVPIAFAAVGSLLVARKPHNLIGWLSMLLALLISLDTAVSLTISSITSLPSAPSLPVYAGAWYSGFGWIVNLITIFFIILFFPTGRTPSLRWRWVVLYGLLIILLTFITNTFGPAWMPTGVDWILPNPLALLPESVADPLGILTILLLLLLAFLCALSLFQRYRRGSPIERKQIKWLLYACGLFVFISMPLGFAGWAMAEGLVRGLSNLLFTLSVLTFPLAVGIAILRYRLFDIDLIIRRTILYALLTGMLASIYFGTVIVLQSLLGQATGEQSPLVIVISTLLIAALFNPLRRRLQAFIDRRFYRQKYDAQQVLGRFAATARDETDVEALSAEMLRVIQNTMHPEQAGLWLKK